MRRATLGHHRLRCQDSSASKLPDPNVAAGRKPSGAATPDRLQPVDLIEEPRKTDLQTCPIHPKFDFRSYASYAVGRLETCTTIKSTGRLRRSVRTTTDSPTSPARRRISSIRFMQQAVLGGMVCVMTAIGASPTSVCGETGPTGSDHAAQRDEQATKDSVVAQTLLRLDNIDLDTIPQAKEALLRHLHRNPDSDDFTTLVRKYRLVEMTDSLIALAAQHHDATQGVDAARLLLEFKPIDEIKQFLDTPQTSASPVDRAALLAALGRTERSAVGQLALEYAATTTTDPALRRAAIGAAGRKETGKADLLKLLQEGRFETELHVTLADVLLSSSSADVREGASKLLALPKTANSEPLPPLSQLVKMRGDIANGGHVFRKEGTCIKCHEVGQEGKQVGPNLSEIGSKLAREAVYVSILDPSAAISFHYETYNVLLRDGRDVTGLLVSDTDDSVTIKTAEAIEHTIPRAEIDEMVQHKVSLMPSGLAQNMTTKQIVDLVEYLLSLKKDDH